MEIIRYLIELIGVFLVLAILIKIFFDPNIAKVKIIETLGIYIIALFKLLPILNRLSTYSQRIRNGLVSAEKIKTFLNTTEQKIKQKNNIDFNSIIELKNISYKYPSQKKLTLDNINFEIKKNQIVGIIGKSGEGKTTLTNILMGLLSPLSGNIFIDGKDMIENNLSISNKTSFLSQIFFSIDANIPDNIVLSDKKINFSNLRYAIRNSMLKSDIANKKLRLKMHMGDSVKNLSGGQLQKINIARAMYRKPQLLIMDEPTSALDIESQKKLANNLLKLKKQMTIIIISHNYEFLVNFDKIYELKNNKLELIKNIA
jgi:ATP-binding cassette subfamily C protein